ncbi:MAG: DUF6599 family protein [Bacteroidota bacterium]
MKAFFPTSVHEWEVSDESRAFSGEEIFGYMDGAGEIYRAYDFQELLTQRYVRPEEGEILVEIFDMGSARNAFGVFTYMQGRGPAVDVGQNGEYKNGLLCFWREKYFVCIMTDKENELAKKAILELGQTISEAIGEDGKRPDILGYLPEGEYLPNTLRYFIRNEILNIHYYVGEGNLLCLNDKTEGVLVRMKGDKSYLVLIEYPNREQADSAYSRFLTGYMPETREEGIVETKRGKWTACVGRSCFVLVVFDASSMERAKSSLETVKGRLP